MTDSKYVRQIKFIPAYDRRDSNPDKNYGIHGVTMHFILKGKEGGIDLCLYTNWHLPHVRDELIEKNHCEIFFLPMPAGLYEHSKRRKYEQQTEINECDICDGEPCYCAGSSTASDKLFDILVSQGENAFWSEMERFYNLWLLDIDTVKDNDQGGQL